MNDLRGDPVRHDWSFPEHCRSCCRFTLLYMGDTSAVKVLKSVALIGTKGLKAKGVWRILGIQELIDTSRKMQGAMC